MLEILKGLQQCWINKGRAALATIVQVDGAAYRREGARCLVLESGSIFGMLSGGSFCSQSGLTSNTVNGVAVKVLVEAVKPRPRQLHSPIGLGIGAESTEDTALSIPSKLACHKNARGGQSLLIRKEPLQERPHADGLLVVNL
ncbi:MULTISPECIES: XdhC family protein [unclassified Paenibacillus]|uniref:XdhC family protein n=1 Tax=unclassified Paenibacillus TaxID=185978 RepID=UPI001AE644C8|nr:MULTISPECIES: XdhC family protein [unclassified Paenibacillus]MBP1157281.1 xanthine/CO dehydrogenase XdhC/CoxF family maturation factor [Paenibacillus sp. PvP091]MBP1171980.1 xanthine/CO dehydrogenase XdhC/CoxF family maturation factor [Paenibacillus sp. PvR098]MBP2438361.1 xanthine/CO dehydrogenase XdhC/CoxF family maturation factor [Paenibacillus sp. PvP052]